MQSFIALFATSGRWHVPPTPAPFATTLTVPRSLVRRGRGTGADDGRRNIPQPAPQFPPSPRPLNYHCTQAMTAPRPSSGSFSVVLPTLAALLFLAALVAILTALALAFPSPIWTPMWNLNPDAYQSFHHLGPLAILLLLALACISAAAASGLLLHKKWAWWIALLIFVANGVGDLISLLRTHQIVRFGSGVLIAAGFVLLLSLPLVRRTLR
jgi:hypothetical protein